MSGILTPPTITKPKSRFGPLIEKQLAEVERAANQIATCPRYRWPQAWDWRFGHIAARQALNGISALRVSMEEGRHEEAIFQMFQLGRFVSEWRREVRS